MPTSYMTKRMPIMVFTKLLALVAQRLTATDATGLTNLAESVAPVRGVRTLMALAGHSQLAITQKYLDLRPSVVRAAVELV